MGSRCYRLSAPGRCLFAPWSKSGKTPFADVAKTGWLFYKTAGFEVGVYETGNTAMRAQLGIPAKLGSCHTARVSGYVLEGHVPVREIHRLLRERPKAADLAVPGMPEGLPGMDGPIYNGRKDPYAVLLVQRDGSTSVYQNYDL